MKSYVFAIYEICSKNFTQIKCLAKTISRTSQNKGKICVHITLHDPTYGIRLVYLNLRIIPQVGFLVGRIYTNLPLTFVW